MSRLFYEPDIIESTTEGEQPKDGRKYAEKVAKLIPGEIIAGYITLTGLVPLISLAGVDKWFYAGIFVLCLILTPIYLKSLADSDKPSRRHLVISTFAFVFWAYAVSGAVVVPEIHDAAIASILLGAFSLVSGKIPLS